jgi:hypothetical protein
VRKIRNAYKMSDVKPEEKRQSGEPWHRLDNIKMGLKEIIRQWISLMWLRTQSSGGLL